MKKNLTLNGSRFSLTIGWLYPELMSIYGDRGNIIVLQKRCEWRGIDVEIVRIDQTTSGKQLATCDLLMMGGAQDSQQTIVARDLEKKKSVLSELIESGTPGLFICGGFQFLGHYYKEADGTIIEQLGVLDVYTENPGRERLIGNVAIEVTGIDLNRPPGEATTSIGSQGDSIALLQNDKIIFVGFENHGGRTVLGKEVKPLGKVLKGYGSNAQDGQEGAVYKNSIGTYFHGPILPKNPELADWLIAKALEKKYKRHVILNGNEESNSTVIVNKVKQSTESKEIASSQAPRNDDIITLRSLDDFLSQKAREVVLKRLGVS